MKITNKTLKLVEAKKTEEWKAIAEELCKEYRKLRFENEVDMDNYDEELWNTYLAYLKLESITLKYSGSKRRSRKMKRDLLDTVKFAVDTTATIL